MRNPFKSKPVLAEQDLLFQIETYRWLLTHFGGDDFYKNTVLVLPTKEFFPAVVSSKDMTVKETFEQVKKYAGMSEWPCKLEAQKEDPNPILAPTIVLQNTQNNPLGTFSTNTNNEAIITYNPKLASDSIQMVATFAHELSHYLTSSALEPPPGGWDNWEFATDICAAFLGFGIFTANAAFSFQQYKTVDSQGWQATRSGYLSEAEYSYALAIFIKLKNINCASVFPFCNPNIKKFLKSACVELDKTHYIQELREVKYEPKIYNDNTRSNTK